MDGWITGTSTCNHNRAHTHHNSNDSMHTPLHHVNSNKIKKKLKTEADLLSQSEDKRTSVFGPRTWNGVTVS